MPKKYFDYPSVGLSAVISQMARMPRFISFLKVRGSYASVGGGIPQGLSSYDSISWDPSTGKWTTRTYKPLDDLYPERTNSWEAGLNARFLDNMFDLNATWYLSNTSRQTITVPLSASSSYSEMYVQAGNVRNWGMEFALAFNHRWGDFRWNSNLTYSFNRNKVTKLLDTYQATDGNTYNVTQIDEGGIGTAKYMLTEGGTMGDLYITTQLKRDQDGKIYVNPTTKNVELETLADPKKIGSVLPSGNLSFRNEFTWKGISLSGLINARLGGVVMSVTQAVLDQYGVSETSARWRDAGGVPVNYGTITPKNYYSVVGGANGDLSEYVYNATNVRLQELSVGYTLPRKWFDNKMSIKLSLVGRNLWMIYNKAPFDPESTGSTGTYMQGMDYFMQPSLRNYGFNVNIQF
jgi:outer membrane receptor protein involved in Fe transport